MNTLIIKYLPSGENSKTALLLDYFNSIQKSDVTEVIDLCMVDIPYFNEENFQIYIKRNFMHKTVRDEESKTLKPFDDLIKKVIFADLLVFVFPMYNYSLPGVVKSFYDAIMFNGETFNVSKSGFPIGLLTEKKSLTLYSSGGDYTKNERMKSLDNVLTLTELLNRHIGIKKYETVCLVTGDNSSIEESLSSCRCKIDTFLNSFSEI